MSYSNRKKSKQKNMIYVIVIACLVIGVLLFGGKLVVSNVKAKEVAQNPIILSSFNVKKNLKEAPVEYNGKIRKIAYLTIDDGPSAYTEKLLNILEKEKVKATFFLIGPNIKNRENMVERMEEEGHYVGMHSMTHDYNKLYKQKLLVPEMKQLQGIIKNITGKTPHLFRAPYGSYPGIDADLRKQILNADLKTWDWTVDSNDWRYQDNPNRIVQEISKQLTETKEVILIHDKKGTVEALPNIIKVLKQKGYEFEVYNENQHFPLNFLHDKNI